MKTSTERILTTHVGSLPRSDSLGALLHKKDQGEPYDQLAFDQCVSVAVDEVVARQVAAKIDLVLPEKIVQPVICWISLAMRVGWSSRAAQSAACRAPPVMARFQCVMTPCCKKISPTSAQQ